LLTLLSFPNIKQIINDKLTKESSLTTLTILIKRTLYEKAFESM